MIYAHCCAAKYIYRLLVLSATKFMTVSSICNICTVD